MKKTTRLLVLLSLCFCFIAVGVVTVFAATQMTLQSGGEINFVANDPEVDATISAAKLQGLTKQSGSGEMKNFSIKPGMNNETIDNLAAFQSWNNISLEFTKESKGMGRILFDVRNNSKNQNNYLYVTFESNTDLSYEITATPSADYCIWPGETHTFDIEFIVQDVGYGHDDFDLCVDVFFSVMNPDDVSGPPAGMNFVYNDYNVVAIDDYTGTATTITVPALVNMGGDICTVEAFDGVSAAARATLKTVNLPRTIKYIGDYAFKQCTALTGNISLPSSVETIGEEAFYGVSNTGSIVLPERLKQIYDMAFSHSKFSSVIFPAGLKYIGADAFWNCTNLNAINLREGLINIGSGAFQVCSSASGELKLPTSLQYIDEYAFSGCSNLTGTLVIPSGVWYIGEYAFSNCTGFTELSLTEGLKEIRARAFSELNLANHNLYLPSTLYYIGEYAFGRCKFTGQIVIPEGMEELCEGIFCDNSDITSLVLPSTVYYVEDYAFGYTGLEEIITYAEEPPEFFQSSFEMARTAYVADYLYDIYAEDGSGWSWLTLKKLSDYPV